VQTCDLLFRPLFLFFLVNQGSRRVLHMAATRSPTQAWTAQQIRNATMDGAAPKYLIRDRDEKFGATFDHVAQGAGVRVIKTAVLAPNMNAVGERFVGSLRREAQRIPEGPANDNRDGKIIASPLLGGLHHGYRRVA
jgi:hypothetical protein